MAHLLQTSFMSTSSSMRLSEVQSIRNQPNFSQHQQTAGTIRALAQQQGLTTSSSMPTFLRPVPRKPVPLPKNYDPYAEKYDQRIAPPVLMRKKPQAPLPAVGETQSLEPAPVYGTAEVIATVAALGQPCPVHRAKTLIHAHSAKGVDWLSQSEMARLLKDAQGSSSKDTELQLAWSYVVQLLAQVEQPASAKPVVLAGAAPPQHMAPTPPQAASPLPRPMKSVQSTPHTAASPPNPPSPLQRPRRQPEVPPLALGTAPAAAVAANAQPVKPKATRASPPPKAGRVSPPQMQARKTPPPITVPKEAATKKPPSNANQAANPIMKQIRDMVLLRMRLVVDEFRQWDVDNSDALSFGEFETAMATLGITGDTEVLYKLFDTDGSGSVSYSELVTALDPRITYMGDGPLRTACNELAATRVQDVLESWDADGDGLISRHEFAKAISCLRVTAEVNQIVQAFDEIDTDGSGKIDRDELRVALEIAQQAPPPEPKKGKGAKAEKPKGPRRRLSCRRSPRRARRASIRASRLRSSGGMVKDQMRHVMDTFREWDSDKNNMVSFEEFKTAMSALGLKSDSNLKLMWMEFDRDGSGQITYEELVTALERRIGDEFEEEEEVKRGVNSTSVVPEIARAQQLAGAPAAAPQAAQEKVKWAGHLHKQPKGPRRKRPKMKSAKEQLNNFLDTLSLDHVMGVFKQWDTDQNGTINRREFGKALSALGLQVRQDDVHRLFNSLDSDNSGMIKYAEMHEYLQAQHEREHAADMAALKKDKAHLTSAASADNVKAQRSVM